MLNIPLSLYPFKSEPASQTDRPLSSFLSSQGRSHENSSILEDRNQRNTLLFNSYSDKKFRSKYFVHHFSFSDKQKLDVYTQEFRRFILSLGSVWETRLDSEKFERGLSELKEKTIVFFGRASKNHLLNLTDPNEDKLMDEEKVVNLLISVSVEFTSDSL